MSLRVTMIAVVTRHLLALDDTRRIGARSNGSGTTMLGVSVSVRTAVKAMALHNTLESATLRGTGDLYLVAWCKDVDGDLVAKVI